MAAFLGGAVQLCLPGRRGGPVHRLQQHWGASPGGEGPDAPGCLATGPEGPYEMLEPTADLRLDTGQCKKAFKKRSGGSKQTRETQNGHGSRP